MDRLKLEPAAGNTPLPLLRNGAFNPVEVELPGSACEAIDRSSATVAGLCASDKAVYGINTGFGKMSQTRISAGKLADLQHNLLLSHSTGTGPLLDDNIVRLIMLLKVLGLARGYSGVRRQVVDALVALINHEVYPCIPAKARSAHRATWPRWPI